jgi:hypothetical protein
MFRLPSSSGYQALINSARAFVEAIVPIKAAFVDRGYPADFDEALVLQIDALEAAALRKYRGLQLQRSGTVDLDLVTRAGMAAVRELGTIVRRRYRETDPALYEAWKSASRPASAPKVVTTPTSPTGIGGSPAPAPAAPVTA